MSEKAIKEAFKRPKPVVLVILDGWGVAPASRGNAITLAATSNYDTFIRKYYASTIQASGEAVGLPWGEMGNSEAGHMNIGAGRIIYQDLPKINQAISTGEFFKNQSILKAIKHVLKKKSKLHLLGLYSPGGVHSLDEHLLALLELAKKHKVPQVCLHLILDGRDVAYNSAYAYIDNLSKKLTHEFPNTAIVTVAGRFWTMDRDRHWERIEKSYLAMTRGEATLKTEEPLAAINNFYQQNIFDEEIPPFVVTSESKAKGLVEAGDGIIFYNFRPDRARQITQAFVLPTFEYFRRNSYLKDIEFVCFTEYDPDLPVAVAFPPEKINWPLARVIADASLKQLHIAETEKYAHVTYFINGGREKPFPGEEHILVPSPGVLTYESKPRMAAREITDRLLKEFSTPDKYDFVVMNFANADMVGHTGNIKATIKGIETIDGCLGKIAETVMAMAGVLIITADHGNAENMVELQTGEINKQHSNKPVPFIIVGPGWEKLETDTDLSGITPSGLLSDLAPTILKIMGLPKPDEMTGLSLI